MAGKKKTEIQIKTFGDSALMQYYSEMGNTDLLGRDGEITLFHEIEESIRKFLLHLLMDEDILNSLIPLSDGISIEKAVEPEYKKAVRNFILGNRDEALTRKFVRAIRFTEAGQEWFEIKTN